MRLADRLYDWLSQRQTPDVDCIFGEALAYAEPAWSGRIIGILLRRATEASWAALIGRFEHLTSEVRAQLLARPDLMQGGISLALRAPASETRLNALIALEQQPVPQLAYLLPEVIRDRSPRVRVYAGRVWRAMAEACVDRAPPRDPDPALRRAYAIERQQMVRALEEGLRTIDVHKRIEVLEMCLWFARDLGETLWRKLSSRRSRAGTTVAEYLAAWNHPRLAHFLVSALRHPAWTECAARVLRTWKSVAEVTALLRESRLLDDARTCQQLSAVHNPRWFTQINLDLSQLPVELRPLAPRWVRHAGYRDADRTALLSRWARSDDAALHNAAVFTLAELDTPEAKAALAEVAQTESSQAAFARWCTTALNTDLVRASLQALDAHTGAAQAVTPAPVSRDRADLYCHLLWQTCRRTPPERRAELLTTLRENAGAWEPQLRAYLKSGDPRDRVLALQVISTDHLAHRFRRELETLRSDPIEGIRQLADTLACTLASRSSAAEPAPPPTPTRISACDARQAEAARQELQTALEWLSAGSADPTDAHLLARVRELLRQVLVEELGAEPTATAQEDRR